MKRYELQQHNFTKYLFFTGKGGVGKTSNACATAVTLADSGKKVLLISTDPASNLQDVFNKDLSNKGTPIADVPGLVVVNLDPIQAAATYRDRVIAPYRGKLPESVIANMEEQLSGSCTVEIAAFNEFSTFITDEKAQNEYDHIIFDTAPTGHTIRMLQLPSAWNDFISESTHGASCLGQLSGLEGKKEIYENVVHTLSDGELTTLVLVSRPEVSSFREAGRASKELADVGLNNQILIVNGLLDTFDDEISKHLYDEQQMALSGVPSELRKIPSYFIPLRAYNVASIENIRNLLVEDNLIVSDDSLKFHDIPTLNQLINDIYERNKKVIFTMGKGGVGKTSMAATIALGLSAKGKKVHLATTDPAAHIQFVIGEHSGITMSQIDEEEELQRYKDEILAKASGVMSENDIAYVEEGLRSPCTQEIAVFRAFAEIVDRADNEVVVIDTAPTGHTLLLLDATENYHREVLRTQGDIPEAVKKLLPRLRNEDETCVIIVTLAETTPVYEAIRLADDLKRAKIGVKWWIINSSLYATDTTNQLLKAKASHEIKWINKVDELSEGNFTVVKWNSEDIKFNNLKQE